MMVYLRKRPVGRHIIIIMCYVLVFRCGASTVISWWIYASIRPWPWVMWISLLSRTFPGIHIRLAPPKGPGHTCFQNKTQGPASQHARHLAPVVPRLLWRDHRWLPWPTVRLRPMLQVAPQSHYLQSAWASVGQPLGKGGCQGLTQGWATYLHWNVALNLTNNKKGSINLAIIK